MLAPDVELGVLGVLQGPEADKALSELVFIGAVDVVLTVTNGDEVRIGSVDVDAGDLTAVSQVVNFKSEQRLYRNCPLLFIFLVDFNVFFFGLLFLLATKSFPLLATFLLFFIIERLGLLKVHRRIGLVKDVLLMELRLCKQPLNNSNRR